jgi:hypothetical protein
LRFDGGQAAFWRRGEGFSKLEPQDFEERRFVVSSSSAGRMARKRDKADAQENYASASNFSRHRRGCHYFNVLAASGRGSLCDPSARR